METQQVFYTTSGKSEGNIGEFKYCPFCRTQLVPKENGGEQRPVCPNCNYIQFRNPNPGVVVLIEKKGNILIGIRREGVGKGKWCLPQGYIEFNEDFLTAAIREVKEETGLDVRIQSIINVVSNFFSPKLHTLTIVLLADVVAGKLCAGDDLENLKWIPFSKPLPEMAFEADEYIIEKYQKMKPGEGLPVDPDFACKVIQ